MKKQFSFETHYGSSFEGEKPCRLIENLGQVEKLIQGIKKVGYGINVADCYVDFENFSEVPFSKAKRLVKEENFKQIIIKGSNGLEILLKNGHHGSGAIGGSFSRTVEGYIKLNSTKEKDFNKIEGLIDNTFPEE